jgi:hypothetical protein
VREWLFAGLACAALGLASGLPAGSWGSGLAGGLLVALVWLRATLSARDGPPPDLP